MKGGFFYIMLFPLIVIIHFIIWKNSVGNSETLFIRYHLFLTLLFILVITILNIIKKIYPDYVGFAFMGLVFFKLTMMLIIRNKLDMSEIPNHKLHFVLPYLIALVLETLYAVNLLKSVTKDEKNQ